MKTIKVMRDGRPATAEELQCAVDGKPLPPSAGSAVVVAHCVLCKEPLTRPGGKKWWIGGSRYDEGLCYDCILAGMRVIMAGVSYAQEHGEGTNANPPNK